MTPDGSKVYVASGGGDINNTVSVIDTATNTVIATIPVGNLPIGVAVTPDGSKVYVTNAISNTVSVIATATNTVIATIPVGLFYPWGIVVTPDGSKVYVAMDGSTGSCPFACSNVVVIATATNTVIATIGVPSGPAGVAVTPDGSKVFVANQSGGNVSVIDTATNIVTTTIPVGDNPIAFGIFIQPPPRFAGTPEHSPIATARASRRSPGSMAGSMPLPQRWGTPA